MAAIELFVLHVNKSYALAQLLESKSMSNIEHVLEIDMNQEWKLVRLSEVERKLICIEVNHTSPVFTKDTAFVSS